MAEVISLEMVLGVARAAYRAVRNTKENMERCKVLATRIETLIDVVKKSQVPPSPLCPSASDAGTGRLG